MQGVQQKHKHEKRMFVHGKIAHGETFCTQQAGWVPDEAAERSLVFSAG